MCHVLRGQDPGTEEEYHRFVEKEERIGQETAGSIADYPEYLVKSEESRQVAIDSHQPARTGHQLPVLPDLGLPEITTGVPTKQEKHSELAQEIDHRQACAVILRPVVSRATTEQDAGVPEAHRQDIRVPAETALLQVAEEQETGVEESRQQDDIGSSGHAQAAGRVRALMLLWIFFTISTQYH